MNNLTRIEKSIYRKLLKQQQIRPLNKIESFRIKQLRNKINRLIKKQDEHTTKST